MSIWGTLFVQQCAVWRYTGMNDTGDSVYIPALDKPPAPFTARTDHTRREVLDKNGNRVLSEASLLTVEPLQPLDKVLLDGTVWEVKSSAPMRNLAGKIDHYEVIL